MKGLIFCILLTVLMTGCSSTKSNEAYKSPKELSQLYTELGTGTLMRGEFPQAIEDFKKALTADPNNSVAYNHLGLAYYGLGQKDLAKKSLETAILKDPNNSDAHINYGNLLQEIGNLSAARAQFKMALDNMEYKFRHRALASLGQLSLVENKTDEARQWLHQSLQANPDYCLSHFLLGSIYARENNFQKAADSFTKSTLSTCSKNPEAYLQLGITYLKLKNFEKARKNFVYLVEEYPQTTQAQKAGEELKSVP